MARKRPAVDVFPKVYVEEPDSFKIQDFLAALAAAGGHDFFMIDPETGRVISDTWLNIPVIWLSTQDRSRESSLGYQTNGQKSDTTSRRIYQPEARIDLEVPLRNLPQKFKEEIWVIQVMDFEKIGLFQPIAIALSTRFKVKVIMTASQMRDPDPDHLFTEPVDRDDPGGAKFCPIIIRKVKK
jgi:hypothetical protein